MTAYNVTRYKRMESMTRNFVSTHIHNRKSPHIALDFNQQKRAVLKPLTSPPLCYDNTPTQSIYQIPKPAQTLTRPLKKTTYLRYLKKDHERV